MTIHSFYKKLFLICVFSVNSIYTINIFANDYLTFFDEKLAINLFTKYNLGSFSDLNPPEYRTDKPFDIGIGVRYKAISAQFSMPVYFTDLSNNWAFDIEMDAYINNIYYEAYFKNYPYFFIEDTEEQSGLSIHSSGIIAAFVHNNKKHSLSSVIKLDKKQNISSGSLLYGFGVFHSSFHSTDETFSRFDTRQHLLYFGPSIGYSYTWVFANNIFLNTSLLLFLNPGININTGNWLLIPQCEPKIVFGHHNNTWSLNLKMMNNAKFIIWSKNEIDILTLVSISIMVSKRF